MYTVLGDAPRRAYPTKLRGALGKLDAKISKVLASGSYSPDDVPKSPIVKEILKLPDPSRRAILLSLCERIAWLEKEDASPWHASENLQF